MDNHDTLFNQIKSAAENAETKDFPGMDKVWSRVEDKLDHKVLSKQTSLWKKIAVAASILLIASIGYQFIKEENEVILPQNDSKTNDLIVAKDSIKVQEALVTAETTNPKIRQDADAILQKQIGSYSLTVNDSLAPNAAFSYTVTPVITLDDVIKEEDSNQPASAPKSTNNGWFANKKFDARGVEHVEISTEKDVKSAPEIQKEAKKDPPLVVMNNLETNEQALSNLNDDEIESIVLLKDPLYIINGVYYTEKEVFGPNPTSPYSPLNQQKIETISILQDEKAISIYGEKGKKGVVIITTKDGKPTPKKGK